MHKDELTSFVRKIRKEKQISHKPSEQKNKKSARQGKRGSLWIFWQWNISVEINLTWTHLMCILGSTVPSPPGLVWPLDTVDKRAHSKLPEPPGTHTTCKGHPPTSPLPTRHSKEWHCYQSAEIQKTTCWWRIYNFRKGQSEGSCSLPCQT